MNRRHALALFAVTLPLGCGSVEDVLTRSTGPEAATPTAAATAPPTAAPTPSELCANGNMPVARFDIKVYTVRNEHNELREFGFHGPFFVGERLRFDSQGKDRFGRRTDGCTGSGPRWSWRPEGLVEWHGDYGWMPSAKVLAPGTLSVSAEFEGGTLDFPLEIQFE